jgi:hypothetical protein
MIRKGIFVDYNVNVINKGAYGRIVLLLLKMVEQYSNVRGNGIDFLTIVLLLLTVGTKWV